MKTIKSIVKEHNKNYKINYDSTLSKNNIGFAIVDNDTQDLDDDEKENIYDDLDFIDMELLCYDYKSELTDKCLEGMIEYNENSTEDKNLLDFNNFIVKKRYEIVKQKIEKEKNMFMQERNTRYELLNNKEKIKRLFKDRKIRKLAKKGILSACSFIKDKSIYFWNSKGYDRLEFMKNVLIKLFDNTVIEDSIISDFFSLDKAIQELYRNYRNKISKCTRNEICLEMTYRTRRICNQLEDEYEKEKYKLIKRKDERKDEYEYDKMKDRLNKYTEIMKQKDNDQKLDEKFQLLKSEYDKTLELKKELDDKDFGFFYDQQIESFYEERKNEINQKLDEIEFKLKQGELGTSEIEDSKERQALITEINEKSSTLKSLQEQTAKLEKQENKDDKNNSDGWIIIE